MIGTQAHGHGTLTQLRVIIQHVSTVLRKGFLGLLALGLGMQAKHPRGCGITRNPEERKDKGRRLSGGV